MQNQINRHYAKQAVKVFAYNGMTAKLVVGTTLHSTTMYLYKKKWQHSEHAYTDK